MCTLLSSGSREGMRMSRGARVEERKKKRGKEGGRAAEGRREERVVVQTGWPQDATQASFASSSQCTHLVWSQAICAFIWWFGLVWFDLI